MLSAGIGGGPSMCMLLLSRINTKIGQTSGLFGVGFPTISVSRSIRTIQRVPEEFFLQLLRNQGINPWVQANFLDLGARGKTRPDGQLVEFIEFRIDRLA